MLEPSQSKGRGTGDIITLILIDDFHVVSHISPFSFKKLSELSKLRAHDLSLYILLDSKYKGLNLQGKL